MLTEVNYITKQFKTKVGPWVCREMPFLEVVITFEWPQHKSACNFEYFILI